MSLLTKIFFVWGGLALLVMNWYSLAQPGTTYTFLYSDIILVAIGIPLWLYRTQIRERLHAWPRAPFTKFLILGYGMVLLEEVFAALANNLSERFSVGLYLVRIGQFWAFNVIAFTALVLGWYILGRKLRFPRTELIVLAGLWGLHAENIARGLGDVPVLLIFIPITMLIYMVIMGPAILSLPEPLERSRHWIVRYLYGALIVLAISIPTLLLLFFLRNHYPWAFPPCNFIPCA